MKDEINLLPPATQKLRKRTLYVRRLYRLASAGLLALLIVVSIQAITLFLLGRLDGSVRALTPPPNQDFIQAQQRVEDANQLVGEINRRVAGEPLWTNRAEELLLQAPADLAITELLADTSAGSFVLKARPSSPQEAVTFQQQVEKLSWVKSVDAPLQNFALTPAVGSPRADVTFTIFAKAPTPHL